MCLRETSFPVKVNVSGAVDGRAVWPSSYKPVAWNNDADTIMLKLGIYHIKNKVRRLFFGSHRAKGE